MADADQQRDEKLLVQLLTPSYLSATVIILFVVVLMGAATLAKVTSSQGWLAQTLLTISESNHQLLQLHVGDGGDRLSLVLLFAFWSCVGLAVYYVVVGLARGVAEVGEVGRELGYVNNKRSTLLMHVFMRLGIRVLALIGAFIALTLLLKFAIPFAVSSVGAASARPADIVLVILSAVVLVVVSHLVIVMMRLVALRPRLFSATI